MASKQSTEPKKIFDSTSEIIKLACEILIVEIQPKLLQKMSLTIAKNQKKSNFC